MNRYKEYISNVYDRVKTQGHIMADIDRWSDVDECDDLFYKINASCLNLYGQGVQSITTTPKCVKMILNDGQAKFVKKCKTST